MKDEREKTVRELMEEGTAVDRAIRDGVREALRRHKALGVPIAVWRNGRVVIVPPEKIRIRGERRTKPRTGRRRVR